MLHAIANYSFIYYLRLIFKNHNPVKCNGVGAHNVTRGCMSQVFLLTGLLYSTPPTTHRKTHLLLNQFNHRLRSNFVLLNFLFEFLDKSSHSNDVAAQHELTAISEKTATDFYVHFCRKR